jgi:hypothetical protein
MVSNVSRCVDGSAAVHRLFEADSSYASQETDVKIAHALQDTEPYTYTFTQAMRYQGCPLEAAG